MFKKLSPGCIWYAFAVLLLLVAFASTVAAAWSMVAR